MNACDLIELELFQISVCLLVVLVFPVVLWHSRIYDGSIEGAGDMHTHRMLEDSLALGEIFVPLPRTIRPELLFIYYNVHVSLVRSYSRLSHALPMPSAPSKG